MTKLEKNKIMKVIKESLIKQRNDEIARILLETECGDVPEFNGKKSMPVDDYERIMKLRRIHAIHSISSELTAFQASSRYTKIHYDFIEKQ